MMWPWCLRIIPCCALPWSQSSWSAFAVRDERASPVPALLRSLHHEPVLTRFIACYAGCSFSNGTRKTNAAFGVACFSFVLIISGIARHGNRYLFSNQKRHAVQKPLGTTINRQLFYVNAAQCSSRTAWSAVALLVCTRAIGIWFFFASCVTLMTILWETVLMNKISKSGQPIFFFKEPFSFAKTFALQPCSLQIFSYCVTILSFPPIITTLMPLLLYFLHWNCAWTLV